MAEDIANLILNKTFLGNNWFIFFSLLIVAIVSIVAALTGSYFSMRGQNLAIRADFKRTLKNIKKQTEAIKNIEEEVSHKYLEKREIIRIKRDKIEEIYTELSRENIYLRKLLAHVMSPANDAYEFKETPSKVKMLISLYFNKEMINELNCYLSQKDKLFKKIRRIYKQQMELPMSNSDTDEFFKKYDELIKNYTHEKIKVENRLMKLL